MSYQEATSAGELIRLTRQHSNGQLFVREVCARKLERFRRLGLVFVDLRDRTGAGWMECKRALLETKGDLDEAERVIREKGLAAAKKRAGRTTPEGKVLARIENGRGAIVAVGVAALHSLPAAIVVLVFFIVYQQAENHLLQPVIMSRTVQLSALAVLVSVLIGVELFGFLGALLAIPVAGVISVISRDLYDSYRGRPKPEPTIGEDQIPVSSPGAPDDGGRRP